MSLKLLMDEHVPKAITTGLLARGVDVTTAGEYSSFDFAWRTTDASAGQPALS